MLSSKVPFFRFTMALSLCTISALNALTLQEGVDEVLSTHPVVQETLHNYRATLEDLRTSESQYLPSLDYYGTIARERTNNPNTAFQTVSLTSYQHSLQLTQNLFNGFGTVYEVDYNNARILAAANFYIENANDAAYQMVSTYINVLKNRDLLCIAESNVKFNEEIYAKVNKLYGAGMTTRSESEKADSSLALAKSNYIVAKNNLDDSLYNLERVLGRHVPVEELHNIQYTGDMPATLEEMKSYAKVHNPSVLVRDYNIKAAKAQKAQSYKNYYPKIDAFARKSWGNDLSGIDGKDTRSAIGLTLSYNLYRGGADESQIQKNLSKIYQESETKRDTVRKLDEQGELAWSAKTHLTEQLKQLEHYNETSAKTLELYQKEYDLGRRTLLDLLVAQNEYIAAQQQIVVAQNNLLFSYYRINDAMGSMVQNILGSTTESYTQKVGLKVLDNRIDNDEHVSNLIFANRQSGVYQRDNENEKENEKGIIPSIGRE